MTDREAEINTTMKIIEGMLKSSKLTLTSYKGVMVVKDETNGNTYGICDRGMLTIESRWKR